jgi:predicted metal-dependent phosphoesterase TrpH
LHADLHLHSCESDGELSPAALVDAVAGAGVGLLALTDHDTTAGHADARKRCAERSVTFVPGIEMTTYAMDRVIHVLGLGFRDGDAGLARACSLARDNFARNQRRWVETLASDGHDVSWERDFVEGAVRLPVLIERLCIGGVEGGDPKRVHAAFSAFFRALPSTAYAELPTPAAAAATIRAAGGIAALAHPHRLLKGPTLVGPRERIGEETGWQLLLDGMDAVEANYAAYDRAAQDELCAIARERGLLTTCGSDYHGYFQGAYVNPRFEPSSALLTRLGLVRTRSN